MGCTRSTNLLIVSADLNGVWDELGSLFLGERGHIFQQDRDLMRKRERYIYLGIFLSLQSSEPIYIDLQTAAFKRI